MEYEKCLVELDEVLNHLDSSDYNKIPKELLDAIKANKDSSYKWIYDETKNLNDQNLDRNTIAMLSYINSEYLLNENEREFMKKIYELNEKKQEEDKREKYNPDDLFKNRQKNTLNKEEQEDEKINKNEDVSLVEIKEEKWYKKVINYIKSLFIK